MPVANGNQTEEFLEALTPASLEHTEVNRDIKKGDPASSKVEMEQQHPSLPSDLQTHAIVSSQACIHICERAYTPFSFTHNTETQS